MASRVVLPDGVAVDILADDGMPVATALFVFGQPNRNGDVFTKAAVLRGLKSRDGIAVPDGDVEDGSDSLYRRDRGNGMGDVNL